VVEMAEEARPFTGEVEIDEPKLAHGACGAGADAEPAARRPSSRPIKRRMSKMTRINQRPPIG
jgi:hypothetical protein